MKKDLCFLLLFLCCFHAFSQVGIETNNPQGVFHVDGNKDNDSSTSLTDTILSNDFMIDSSGKVGVGTITPMGKLDVQSTTSGFVLPRMNTDQRDSMQAGYRPSGTIVYNTDLPNMQVNLGTDESPAWTTVSTTNSASNPTLYKMVVYSRSSATGTGAGTQKVSTTATSLLWNKTVFNNTPSGYVSLGSDSATVSLAKGKNYKIDFNVGRATSDDSNHTWCFIVNSGTTITSMSLLPSTFSSSGVLYNWNTINTMQAFVDATNAATTIRIVCNKSNSGNVWFNSGIAPVLSITIID